MWDRKAASQAAAMRERSDSLLLDASQYENDSCDYVKGDFVCEGVAPAAGVAAWPPSAVLEISSSRTRSASVVDRDITKFELTT